MPRRLAEVTGVLLTLGIEVPERRRVEILGVLPQPQTEHVTQPHESPSLNPAPPAESLSEFSSCWDTGPEGYLGSRAADKAIAKPVTTDSSRRKAIGVCCTTSLCQEFGPRFDTYYFCRSVAVAGERTCLFDNIQNSSSTASCW